MPEFWATKDIGGLLHPDDDGREYLKKVKSGSHVLVSVKQPRNIKFHRKFFALLKIVFENQERYEDFEAFRMEVTLRCGYWQEHVHLSGQVSYTPKSIAFHKMDELEFSELYNRAIDVLLKHFIPGADEDELRAAVEGFSG